MKRLVFVTLVIAASLTVLKAAPRQSAGRAPLTPEQTLDRRAIGDLEFSPDGSRLAFTVTEPVKGTARARAIWLLDVASGRARPLTFSGKSDGSPRWAPDGSAIAFTSDRDGPAQLYRLSMRGGEAEKLTDRRESVGAFRWSPDGTRIALVMAEPKADAQTKRERDKDDSRVVDKDDRRTRIWLLDVGSHELKQVTRENWRIGQIEWLPSGDRLIAAASPNPASDQWNERIYSVDAKDGRFAEIGAPRGPMGALAVSPDGRKLAYVGARVDGPDAHDIFVLPLSGGAARNLTASSLDKPVSQPKWIDNQVLAVHVARGFASTIAIVDAEGRAQPIDIGVNPSTFARASTGTWAYVGETATRAPELWVKAADADVTSRRLKDSPPRMVTTVNEKWASIPVVAPEFVKYKSIDGVEIEAALLQPPATSHQPLPFVVLVHGGPTGRWSDSFEAWGQLLASRGYAVLYPNVRGSTGYGQRFVEMNRADWGGGDFKDVMAGVDWAIAGGIADPNRLGIGGWSYGGYMAAWAVTQTSRFKAAVSGAPVIDMASEFGTENGSAYDEWFYGTPYEKDKLDGFIRSSPMTFVKNVKTPTLLLQGEDDTTDPIGQSQQFYRGLKRYGVDADLVLYPREPHGLREEKHLLDRLNRIIAWYDNTSSQEARRPRNNAEMAPDERLAEDALRVSETRLRHIVEHAQDLIYYCDVDGHFTYVNPAATLVMQFEETELIGRHFLTLIRSDFRAAAVALYTKQIQERLPNTYFEFPAVTKAGGTVWVGQHVQIVYAGDQVDAVHAIARDITSQKDAEDKLKKSEARYRSLIQGAAYAIFRTTIDGTILNANPALAEMLGYDSVEDLMTRKITEVYAFPAEREAVLDQYREQNPESGAFDVHWKRKDGAVITVHLTARVVQDDEGVGSFEGIAEDITARRALEDQLREAQKMEAVGRLARGIAHDFNNLLAAILGSSDLLAKRLQADDPSREEALDIRKAAERGASLTRQLMTFSRSQALEPQRVDLTEALPQLESLLRNLAGASALVDIRVPAIQVPVMIEPGQLEQVMLNLVVNARDAMPDGGPIDIALSAVTLDDGAALRIPGVSPGAFARIAVRDTGVGIAPEAQAHIFEPFFTTKDASKGTGLGLSIVYGIAREARGAVTFSTAPNAGTTFEVWLPLAGG